MVTKNQFFWGIMSLGFVIKDVFVEGWLFTILTFATLLVFVWNSLEDDDA